MKDKKTFVQGASTGILLCAIFSAIIIKSIFIAVWSILITACALGVILGVFNEFRIEEDDTLPCRVGEIYFTPAYEFGKWVSVRVRVIEIEYKCVGDNEVFYATTERVGSGRVEKFNLEQVRAWFSDNRLDAKKAVEVVKEEQRKAELKVEKL